VNPDLQHLILLQQLDLEIDAARRRIADLPNVQQALDASLAAHREQVAAAKQVLTENQAARREIEKEVAALQARLSKYKDQLMEVKTNKEYQAMQKEIATAEETVRGHEDRLLERMVEADTFARQLKDAEAELKRREAEVAAERQALDAEAKTLDEQARRLAADRGAVAADLPAPALSLFEHVARQRKGQALAEARDGHCTVCHVRLRPQVFNDVRRNDMLIQCESCSRILYFVPPAPASKVS
jgi:uncharacterized protein